MGIVDEDKKHHRLVPYHLDRQARSINQPTVEG